MRFVNTSPTRLKAAARIALDENDLEKAEQFLTLLCHVEPDNASLWDMLGCVHFNMGNLASAEHDFNTAINVSDAYPDALINLGKLMHLKKDYQHASDLFKKAISIDPGREDARNLLADLEKETTNHAIRLDYFTKILEEQPGNNTAFRKYLKSLKIVKPDVASWEGIDRDSLPDFVIMGAMKAGTTSLHYYLDQHPDIFMSRIKEPNLFCSYVDCLRKIHKTIYNNNGFREHRRRAPKLRTRADAVNVFLKDYEGQNLKGESSTAYTKAPEQGKVSPALIKDTCPDMKFIYVLRNPLERIFSHYRHMVDRQDREDLTPTEFINKNYSSVVNPSLYFFQLSRYLKLFNPERFHFVISEELTLDPEKALNKIRRFLGIKDFRHIQSLRLHASSNKANRHSSSTKLDSALYAVLMDDISRDLEALENFLGRRLDMWDLSKERWCY